MEKKNFHNNLRYGEKVGKEWMRNNKESEEIFKGGQDGRRKVDL